MFQHQERWNGEIRRGAVILGGLLLTLAVNTPARAAEVSYKIERIAKFGDRAGDVNIKPTANGMAVLGLNDLGQLLFVTFTAENPSGAAILRYADGQFTTIAAPERDGPIGAWPNDTIYREPSSMNQAGNVVFSAMEWNDGDPADLGTFLWDAKSGETTPIVVQGMPATGDLTFAAAGFSPMLNNRGEIVFPGWGQFWSGIFLRSTDGSLQPITRTEETMPDGRKLAEVFLPCLNDAGLVTFLGLAADDLHYSAYLWEKGAFTPVAVLGTDAPDGGKIRDVRGALLNNQNRSVLVLASRQNAGRLGLYRFADGKLTTIVVPAQTLPDGGIFGDIQNWSYGLSPANELGQHAFLARLQDGSTAAYLLEPDGTIRPILKSGQVTELGKITLIGVGARPSGGLIRGGWGIALNRQGQVALNVSIDGGPTTLVLLTPKTP